MVYAILQMEVLELVYQHMCSQNNVSWGITFTYPYPIHKAFPHSAPKSVKFANLKSIYEDIGFKDIQIYQILRFKNIQHIQVSKHMDM